MCVTKMFSQVCYKNVWSGVSQKSLVRSVTKIFGQECHKNGGSGVSQKWLDRCVTKMEHKIKYLSQTQEQCNRSIQQFNIGL